MAESDGAVEVLKEIREEIRGVRTELLEQMRVRLAGPGMRTALVDRAARWRIAAMAGTGAVALVALVVALRAGGQPAPPMVTPSPQVAQATTLPVPAMAPVATPAPAPLAAAKPVVAKPAAHLPAVVAVPKKQVRPTVAPNLPAALPSDDETMAFSPPPRRVRVHKMSYGPIESEPAKL